MVAKFLLVLFSVSAFANTSNIFEGKTQIENPFDLRDPFKAPQIRSERESNVVGKKGDGIYSNIPIIGELQVSQLEVVGVIIGKNRRAFVRIRGEQGGPTYTIKEGQILGENDAELKAILPGGLILVEKTTNIYGQEEYLETVIPISK